MIISSSEAAPKIVHDYDILFVGGLLRMLTICPDLGDTVGDDEEAMYFNLPERPAFGNPKQILPAEDYKFFKRHILSIQHRVRTVEPVPAQIETIDVDWQQVDALGRPN